MRLRVACAGNRTVHEACAAPHAGGIEVPAVVRAAAVLVLVFLCVGTAGASDLSRGQGPAAATAGHPHKPNPAPGSEPEPAQFRSEAGDRVFFSESSTELGTRARVALETQALWLIKHPSLLLVVEGHADDPGDERANLRLSQARADVVRERLLKLGVSPDRVMSVGFGRAHPAVVCREPSCAAHNRRVVTQVREQRSAEGNPSDDGPASPLRTAPRRLF